MNANATIKHRKSESYPYRKNRRFGLTPPSGSKIAENSDALFDSWHADEEPSRHLPSSKIDRICSRLFMCNRSASSIRIIVVGSGTAFFRASYGWKVWK
jgi:hypothetical protein